MMGNVSVCGACFGYSHSEAAKNTIKSTNKSDNGISIARLEAVNQNSNCSETENNNRREE
jgi:hypothetical protein